MHRPPKLPAAVAAGLALFLAACAGETPTSPKPAATPGSGGPCTFAIALPAGPITTFAGTAISLRASVTNGGVAVADNTSVSFTTDLGFFNENGLPTISKTTRDGVADVSPGSLVSGTATVRAAFNCAVATVQIIFEAPPDTGPFISDVQPNTGSSAGGDTVVISGGRFGTSLAAISSVTFGGPVGRTAPLVVTNTSITVRTPPRTLANPQVPETVDVCVNYVSGLFSVCKAKAFTYFAINPNQRMAVTSLSPTSGAPAGGDAVTILGTNFGTSVATTRVTFCGLSAQILSMGDNTIVVSTPRHVLANPAISETCDVVVTIDLGKVSTQSAVLPQSFTYRGSGGSGTCGTDPSIFISSLSLNSGPPDGGTVITIIGGGFPTNVASVRVDFGGTPAQVNSAGATAIGVVTPRHTLADPLIAETVDVVVTDLGSPTQRCARLAAGFTYTQQALTPVIFAVSPPNGPNDVSISVSITGDGFQAPERVFLTGGACGAQLVEAAASLISRTQIVFQSPLAQGAGSTPCLKDSQMDVRVTNPTTGKSATCPGCFRYGCRTIGGFAAPDTLNQDGSSLGAPGTPALVTVTGTGFIGSDALTVSLIKNGTPIAGTTVNATVTGTTTFAFLAPPVPDTFFNQNQCSTSGGAVDGTQSVPTRFGIRVTNTKTLCTSDLPGTLLYNPKASLAVCTATPLTPKINSISPTTGPNDAPTRVTIFGTGFQFPAQVFLTGGSCGTQKIEVPIVAPITLNQIVFQTPVAAGAYACLAGSQVDVQVLNVNPLLSPPNNTATCPGCFKFFACPTGTAASPSVIPTNGATVIVSGNNFQQPVEATFLTAGQPAFRLTVTSVSSTSVVVQMPPFASIVPPGAASCQSIVGTINISSTALSCPAATVPVTYRPDAPTLSSAAPTTLTQDGGPPITVNGTGFGPADRLTVTLIKDNIPVAGTTVTATASAEGVLTFTAPAVPDVSFNRNNCSTSPGGPLGSQAVPTRFGIRVTNLGTGCSGDLAGVLLYNPRAAIAGCTLALQITTATLTTATLCTAYNSTIAVSGGSIPYLFSLSGAPPWLTINLLTGVLSGTPDILSPPGTGGPYSVSFTVNVTDAASASTTKNLSLLVTDPDGPFSISTPSTNVTVPAGGGTIPLTALPNPTPLSFAPVNWSFVVPPADPGITLSAATGQTVNVNVAVAVPTGSYSVQVQALDSPSCAGATHTAILTITVNKS